MNYIHKLLILMVFVSMVNCSEEEAIPIEASFSVEVANNDFSVPVRVEVSNTTEGADTYNWSFEGGRPSSSTDREPGTITYEQPGNYTIILQTSNVDGLEDTASDTLQIDTSVFARFEIEVLESNFPPVEINIDNQSAGATSFQWEFEGGIPATSQAKDPPNVRFEEPGVHQVKLTVSNGRETYNRKDNIRVATHLRPEFQLDVAFQDDDYEIPVKLTMVNKSVSATDYQWTFEGANTAESTDENPEVVINEVGTHTITLSASNGKETKEFTREVTVFDNTNLRMHTDIQLGIFNAHNSDNIGAFFSTTTREVYSKSEVNQEIGPKIDLVYLGGSSSFGDNRFFSPNAKKDFPFDPIPGAIKTKLINNQELHCGNKTELCEDEPRLLSVSDFDAMENDIIINALNISETNGGLTQFDNTIVPRIVLFETYNGRKGAIKIKEFIENGDSSYILVDIKVQKDAR